MAVPAAVVQVQNDRDAALGSLKSGTVMSFDACILQAYRLMYCDVSIMDRCRAVSDVPREPAMTKTRIATLWQNKVWMFDSHPGICYCCVIVDYSNKIFYEHFFFQQKLTISSIYTLVAGNMPYGKRHISRTERVLVQA